MAGNRRGRLKEHFEGIHKNFDWIIYHCTSALELIAGDNAALTKGIKALASAVQKLDGLAKGIYDKL